MTVHFALFGIAMGSCAIARGTHGVRDVRLPEASSTEIRCRMVSGFQAPRSSCLPEIERVREAIASLLHGMPGDFSWGLSRHGPASAFPSARL
jgi:hypothetical protein